MKFNGSFKKIMAIIVVALFILAAVLPLSAMFVNAQTVDELQKKLEQNASDKKNIQGNIKEKEAEKDTVTQDIKNLDAQIGVLNSQISDVNSKIAADDAKIAETQKKLDEAEARQNEQYELFKVRIRVMYENGSKSNLEMLLDSKGITDFLDRMDMVKQITEHDKKLLEEMKQLKNTIAASKAELEDVRAQKVARVTVLNASKSSLDSKVNEKNALISSLNSSIAQLEKQLKKKDADAAAIRAQVAKLQNPNVAYTGGSMLWPAPGYTSITSPYGSRYHPVLKYNRFHSGIDIGAPSGSKVIAANGGKVIRAEYSSSYGNYVIVDHGGGISTLYAHGSRLCTSVGQTVTAGQEILRVGSTGISTGPHLHFEVMVNGKTTNPLSYVR